MNIKNYPLKPGQWMATATPKQYVVWHGTTGRTAATPANGQPGKATSTIDYWNSDPAHVGAPWVIDRDGTIYNVVRTKRIFCLNRGCGTRSRPPE